MAERAVNAELRFPRFWSRPPWLGGDLQTVRNYVSGVRASLQDYPSEPLRFAAEDGSGDMLTGTLSQPQAGEEPERPLVLLLHGLTGSEESFYMLRSARALLEEGYPVLRLNLRGAGSSRSLCRHGYHAGQSEDLRAVLRQLDGRLARRGLFIVGVSLGGNLLLKYLGEEGSLAPVLGAVSVSAPIDLKAAQLRLMRWRNRHYQDFLLTRIKAAFPAEEVAAIDSIYAFDETFTAPRNGFAGADDYYRHSSALPLLGRIRVRTLLIHARNDPWIPMAPYRLVDTRANPRLTVLLPRGGGHVGFHGLGSRTPWHDRCIALFLGALAR